MDGSQKIPQRWLETLAARQREGLESPAILSGVAAWLRHVRGDLRMVDDPMAEKLAAAWNVHAQAGIVEALFGKAGLIASDWRPGEAEIETLTSELAGS